MCMCLLQWFYQNVALSCIPCKQSQQLLTFLYFPLSHLPKNGRLCQLLALCLKCHHQKTWTGFQTFFEFQHSNSYKKNDQTSLHELCVQISNFLKTSAFNSFGPPTISSTFVVHKVCKIIFVWLAWNCLITWCFSLIIVKTSMKNRYFQMLQETRNYKVLK